MRPWSLPLAQHRLVHCVVQMLRNLSAEPPVDAMVAAWISSSCGARQTLQTWVIVGSCSIDNKALGGARTIPPEVYAYPFTSVVVLPGGTPEVFGKRIRIRPAVNRATKGRPRHSPARVGLHS